MTGPVSFDTDFFVVGGTLRGRAASYVTRPADDELFYMTLAGRFCYVLTPRQMGKSSLMVRTARRLRTEGVATAIVDLTSIGISVTIEQWYLGLVRRIAGQLHIRMDFETWWEDRVSISPVQRFADFLHDVVLAEIDKRIVILIDEIDSTLSLDFTDDFFAAIRAVYNARATDSAYARLTFALFGVATPTDLIKDRTRTPFNIGQRIDLREFSKEDARVLREALQQAIPDRGSEVFRRIFYWTNGHPYLTQKLCAAVSQSPHSDWTDAQIDHLVDELFISDKARRETNLQFMDDNIRNNEYRVRLVKLYNQIYQGKEVIEDERAPEQNQLKLYGLIQSYGGKLEVRNRIYRRVFNQEWIKANSPVNWMRRIVITAVVIVFILAGVAFWLFRQGQQSEVEIVATAESRFVSVNNASTRVLDMYTLLQREDKRAKVLELFAALSPEDKLALFSESTASLEVEIHAIVQATYADLVNNEDNNKLLEHMADTLAESNELSSAQLEEEIRLILAGRKAVLEEDNSGAYRSFTDALQLNDDNPLAYFDRAMVQIPDLEALDDFQTVLEIVPPEQQTVWKQRIKEALLKHPSLYATLWEEEANYPFIIAMVGTLTPTPVSTLTPTPVPSNSPEPTATNTLTPMPTVTATPPPTPTRTPAPTSTSTPKATNTPLPTRIPVTSTPAVGSILFTSGSTVMTTDPEWSSAHAVGLAESNTCGSPAIVDGDAYPLFYSPICHYAVGTWDQCPSPNRAWEIVVGSQTSIVVLTIRLASDRENDEMIKEGAVSSVDGIRWSPNNDFYVFVDDGNLYIYELRTQLRAIIPGIVSQPVISKDGSQILFVRGNDIFVTDAFGSNERNVTNGSANSISCAAWNNN